MPRLRTTAILAAALASIPFVAAAQPLPDAPVPPPAPDVPAEPPVVPEAPAPASSADSPDRAPAASAPMLTLASGVSAQLDGYVEAHYSYNFNQPSNGVTNYRGFDDRHDTFAFSNAVIGANVEASALSARVALQFGRTPTTAYLAEPSISGASGSAPSGADVFRYIQQAYAGWKAPVGRGLLIQAGIFLSPVGYEGIAVKDNWNYSRSNLFFGLPCYHMGIHATYEVSDRLSIVGMVSNGWNTVLDNNGDKSVTAQILYKVPDRLTLSLLYSGGNERPKDAPEGAPWRHLFDVWAQVDVSPWLSFAGQADGGFEENRFGTSYWGAGALYARVHPAPFLYVAARGDLFRERAARSAEGTAARIFWPANTVSSGTVTADFRPGVWTGTSNVSVRVELRHDAADAPMFFQGNVKGDGVTTPYVTNARAQDTVTVGLTGWF